MHEVLVNRLGGLSLPRKSVVRLTDRPDMTLDVYRGRKTTMQQQQQPVPGRPTIWMIVGPGAFALAVGAGGGLFGHFYSPLSFLSSFSLSLGDGPI